MNARVSNRRGMALPTRVTLLESDVDEFELEMARAVDRLSSKLDTMNKVMSGFFVAATLAALTFAINVLSGAF